MKTLLLIDTNSFIHRAFHALPPFTGPEGQPTGALYGLTNTLLKLVKDKKPDYIAAALDRKEPTFRKKKYKEYKAHRPKAPDELIAQIIEAPTLLHALGIPTFSKAGFEADDVIGTLARTFKSKDVHIIILTGDLDMLQLVEKGVTVEVPRKGLSDIREYDAKAVEERFGVDPARVPDYKGLVGDTSDNIPGVPGVGPKTAASLLQEFTTVENLYKKIKESHKFAKKILPHKEDAILSKWLATIRQDVPLDATKENTTYIPPKDDALIATLKKFGFRSLVSRFEKNEGSEPQEIKKAKSKTSNTTDDNTIFIPNAEHLKTHPDALTSKKEKVAYDWKEILKSLGNPPLTLPIFDIHIAGWLLNPSKKDVSLDALTKRFFNTTYESDEEALRELYVYCTKKIKEYELTRVFTEIEMPLIPILAKMEARGIGIDTAALETLQKTLAGELEALEKNIYAQAKKEFNINSSQQVAEVLFDDLGITDGIKKTATGKRSTREEVLHEIKNAHPIIPLLLEYREVFKVSSTYADPLKELGEKDGRIHTTYVQTGTATGRLSSRDPNLQNIPQGSRWAKPIRNAFRANEGYTFLTFDYSQLELRLLAHVSGDAHMRAAFENNEDIHALSAAKVFKLPIEKVTPEIRRVAKTLNFGIVYGMGPRALSRTSDISLQEAKTFIQEYFHSFPDIRPWQEERKKEAETRGYVETENGRRRWFEKAELSHPRTRGEVERMAINMPIQGLNADILKLAMISVTQTIERKEWSKKIHLLLTIHDELLFEVADDILKEVTKTLQECMESVYTLTVPLKVEAKAGKRWGEMKTI